MEKSNKIRTCCNCKLYPICRVAERLEGALPLLLVAPVDEFREHLFTVMGKACPYFSIDTMARELPVPAIRK